MTVELDQEDRDKALEYLHRGRFRVLEKEPFFGYCACRLGLVERDSVKTLETDGQNIFYNPLFVLTCKDDVHSAKDYALSEILHEVLHNILLHVEVDLRTSTYDIQRALAAMDHAVNIMIDEMGYPVHKDWLFDKQYKGMTWREIYEKLPPMSSCNCVVSPQDKSGSKKGDGEGDADGKEKPQEINEWEKIIIEAAKFADAMGKTPAFVKDIVENITKPRVDWRGVLYRFMSRVKKGQYSFRRPNKRYLGRGMILPSLHTYTAHALIVIDTSGSTWQFLNQYWGEIWGIMKALGLDVDVIMADTDIKEVIRLKKPDDVKKMQRVGGGGTDFCPVFEYVAKGYTSETKNGTFKRVEKPEVMVFLTDAEGLYPDSPPDYRVLWCVSTPKGMSRRVPPFGQVLFLPVE